VGRIIPFRRDEHQETQRLLPWYAKGRLDDADRALVETHLATCADCAAELAVERELAEEVARLPLESDQHWVRLRSRIAGDARPRRAARRLAIPAWAAFAAGVCVAALLTAVTLRGLETPAYRTLSAPPAHRDAAMVVIFRPDTREADLRRLLTQADARLVDGPTVAGAYMLSVSPAEQSAALALLRNQPQVVLAQPLGTDPR
jgi:anti-sigma factor RsiW